MTGDPVWINGSLAGRIDPFDRGLTLGDGVFDTCVALRRLPFAGERHLARLTGQAAEIGVAIDADFVRAGWDAVLAEAYSEHAIIRTTVTRGTSGRGLWPASLPHPTVMVSAHPWERQAFGRPVRLVRSAIVRNPASPSSRLKTIGYLDNILAARETAERGADDAILLNPSGHVACTTIANVFAIEGEELVTPPLSDGVLAGIMRGIVLELAASVGLHPVERSLAPADLAKAGNVFLTNSVRFLSPVISLDGRPLAVRHGGHVEALSAAIAEEVRLQCAFDPRGGGMTSN